MADRENANIDDDDSENDSDYVPEPETEEVGADAAVESSLKGISAPRKRKIEALWEEMISEDRAETGKKMARAVSAFNQREESASGDRVFKKKRRMESVLSKIFGRTAARKMIATTFVGEDNSAVDDANNVKDLRSRAMESVKKIVKRTKVTETRKFAGQSITVERTVMKEVDGGAEQTATTGGTTSAADAAAGGKDSNSSSSSGGVGSGIDNVLETIKGPKGVSTVAKSSIDWDNYKDSEGLEDELQAASKEGYLARKEFLERVDVRTYEKEKADRQKGAR